MMLNRRELLIGAGLAVSLKAAADRPDLYRGDASPDIEQISRDETWWGAVQESFLRPKDPINLNAAGVSPQPVSVQDAVIRNYRFANEIPTVNMWERLDSNRDALRAKLANLADCSVEEVALNRNSTEGLCTVIHGIDLEPGDEVVLSKWDYYSMRYAWQQREARHKIRIRWVDFDLPENHTNIIRAYADAITPRTRVIHLTQLIHYTGQIMPIKAICELARGKPIQTIVDAAQSFAHIPLSFRNLDCDYMAVSLHKWLCAPFGSGLLVVRKNKIKALWPLLAPLDPEQHDSIGKFDGWSLGTYSSAREQGIGDAVDFHNRIGGDLKYRRLQYLKHYWTDNASAIDGLNFQVPLDDAYSASVVLVSIRDLDGKQIADALRNKFGVHVVDRIYGGMNGVRVSPHIYTKLSDLDRLNEGLEEIAKGRT